MSMFGWNIPCIVQSKYDDLKHPAEMILKCLSTPLSLFVYSEYQVKKLPHGVRCAKVNSCSEKQSPDSACSMDYSSSLLSSPEHPGEGRENETRRQTAILLKQYMSLMR